MAHNESNAKRETTESDKPSKLQKIKKTALVAGAYAVPVAIIGASVYFSIRMTSNQLEAAKLNLEAAKLNHPTA